MNAAGKAALSEMREETRALACRYIERAKTCQKQGDEEAAGGLKVAAQELHALADEVYQAGINRRYRPEPAAHQPQSALDI